MENNIDALLRKAYSEKYLESAQKKHYSDLTEEDGLEIVLYKDLPKTEVNGVPIASDYVDREGHGFSHAEWKALPAAQQKGCELRYYFLPAYHTLGVGTTGSGKTTGYIEPCIRAASTQKNKPNFFITDPKGELYERHAKHLIAQGYRLKVLNFIETARSDAWNPLLELYEYKKAEMDIGKDLRRCSGEPDPELIKMPPFDKYGERYYVCGQRTFPTKSSVESYIFSEKSRIQGQISTFINQFSQSCIKPSGRENDPTWLKGAQNLLRGILNCMLCDIERGKHGFDENKLNYKNIQAYYLKIRRAFIDTEEHRTYEDCLLTADKPAEVTAPMNTALLNAPNTRRSYCGVFEDCMDTWFQYHIKSLTTTSTIHAEKDLCDESAPFAIFLMTRDYDKSDFAIAALFVDWVYRVMLQKAERTKPDENGVKHLRATHFYLDEFGNIPAIPDFELKIATSRSRNIWFHLMIQSYMQLDNVYSVNGKRGADIIRDNCNSQVFLGAQDTVTKEIFSRLCGQTSVSSLEAMLNDESYGFTQVPTLPVSTIDLMKTGEAYVKRLRMPVFSTRFIRSYEAHELGFYKNYSGGTNELPYSEDMFSTAKYTLEFADEQHGKRNILFDKTFGSSDDDE